MCCLSCCWHSSTPTKWLQLPSKGQQYFYSTATWTSIPIIYQLFSISIMAAKHSSQGTNCNHCSWYHWLGWWHWSKALMQYHQHCYTPGWLHHTNRSASGGTRSAGTATVVTRGSSIQPEVVTTIKAKGRSFMLTWQRK